MMLTLQLIRAVAILSVRRSSSATCIFEHRPDLTTDFYNYTEDKAVYGSVIQEDIVFFDDWATSIGISYVFFVGFFWANSAAAVLLLFTKMVPHFGWKDIRPNLCGALIAFGSFAMGLDRVMDIARIFMIHFESDLAYMKMREFDLLISTGWICYLWALNLFTSFWIDVSQRCGGVGGYRMIRFSVAFVSISGTLWFVFDIILGFALLSVQQSALDLNSNLVSIDKPLWRTTMPQWFRVASSVSFYYGLAFMFFSMVLNTIVAVEMNKVAKTANIAPTHTFVRITHINFYQQMVFNVCLALLIVLSVAVNFGAGSGWNVPLQWSLCIMVLSWGAEFTVIFAHAEDRAKGSDINPFAMFGETSKATAVP